MLQGFGSHSGSVLSGQTLSGFILPKDYGLIVENGGTLLDATAASAGDQITVYGVAIGTGLEDGSLAVEAGGSMTGTLIGVDGFVQVLPGGAAFNDIIASGGFEYADGADTGTTIMSGGVLAVEGGVASAVTVDTGGLLSVVGAGLIAATTLQRGADLQIFTGGLVMSGDVVGAGAVVAVLPEATPATASATVLMSGAILLEVGGATLSGVTVAAGAHVAVADVVIFNTSNRIVAAGNHLNGMTVASGGYETVYAGGFVTSTVLEKDTQQVVQSGGTAVATAVRAGEYGGGQVVSGLAVSTIVQSGGEQNVQAAGGLARDTLVHSGGMQSVGGTSISATVLSGGVADITDGITSGAVLSGGSQTLTKSSLAYDTRILLGGVQTVSGNSVASGSVVSGGGVQDLDGGNRAGPQASGTVIQALGTEVIKGGAIAMSSMVLSGGLQNDLAGTASGTVIAGGGELRIESESGAADVTVSLGGIIDYADVAFVSGATATVNDRNVLMVHDGGTTLVLQLVGNYSGEQFVVTADHARGTFVTLSAAADAHVVAAGRGEMLGHGDLAEPAATESAAALMPATESLHARPGSEPILLLQHH